MVVGGGGAFFCSLYILLIFQPAFLSCTCTDDVNYYDGGGGGRSCSCLSIFGSRCVSVCTVQYGIENCAFFSSFFVVHLLCYSVSHCIACCFTKSTMLNTLEEKKNHIFTSWFLLLLRHCCHISDIFFKAEIELKENEVRVIRKM